jgi:hypothetical protein
MTLVETGTRALIGAVFGPTREGETDYARRLLRLLTPDMVVLWDKGFDSNAFLADVHATGARILGRLRDNRRIPVLARLVDGSYLSTIGAVRMRVIDARITVIMAGGPRSPGPCTCRELHLRRWKACKAQVLEALTARLSSAAASTSTA